MHSITLRAVTRRERLDKRNLWHRGLNEVGRRVWMASSSACRWVFIMKLLSTPWPPMSDVRPTVRHLGFACYHGERDGIHVSVSGEDVSCGLSSFGTCFKCSRVATDFSVCFPKSNWVKPSVEEIT